MSCMKACLYNVILIIMILLLKKVRKLQEVSMFSIQNLSSHMLSLLWENINWSDKKYADLAYF